MSTQVTSNASAFVLASGYLASGEASIEHGTALMLSGLIDWTHKGVAFLATVTSGKGENQTSRSKLFRLADYPFPIMTEKGKVDGLMRSAQLAAIMDAMGIDTPAMRACFTRCLPAALILARSPSVTYDAKAKTIVKVPASIALKLYKDDGDLNDLGASILEAIKEAASLNGKDIDDEEATARLAKATVPLSGAHSRTYGQLPTPASFNRDIAKPLAASLGLIPAPKAGTPRTSSGASVGLETSLTFLIKTIREQVEGDEAEEAFTNERVAEVRELATLIAAFLEAEEA
jgi:hypothetical protein